MKPKGKTAVHCRIVILLLLTAALGLAAPVTITDDGSTFHPADKPERRSGSRLFRISGMTQQYGLKTSIQQQRGEDGAWRTINSHVGMPLPTEANWFHSAFFGITANGRTIQDRDVVVSIDETGEQGLITFSWQHPLVDARVRFLLEAESDKLLMEVRWEGRPELKALAIEFVCYPQGYRPNPASVAKQEVLNRRMITAVRDIRQVNDVALDLPEEWWQIYQDTLLERAPFYNPSGPCALAILPDDVELAIEPEDQTMVKITDYPVMVKVNLAVTSGRARFALWDFTGKTTTDAEAIVTQQAPALLEHLRHASWLPTAITSFNAEEQVRELDNLAAALGDAGEPAVTNLRTRLTDLAPRLEALRQDLPSFAGEQQIMDELADYRLGVWQAARPTRHAPRVLLLEGLFGYAWRVAPIVRQAWGGEAVRKGDHSWKYWIGHRVSWFPATMDELLGFDVVVMSDFPQDPLTPDMRRMLAEFVQKGGGLLVLGGTYAYGAGAWAESPIEPLLPVQIGGLFDLRKLTKDPPLHLTEEGASALGTHQALGTVPWVHEVTARPGSTIWMTAGERPVAVAGTAGEGRVVTILGAPLGDQPAPCWESEGWPALLAGLLRYLASGRSEP